METNPVLTKREYFVAMAMQGLCANANYEDWTYGQIAEYAAKQAAALLDETMPAPAQINLNAKVRVKLTASGLAHLKRVGTQSRATVEDWETVTDGWSVWQLWDLMGTFGHMLQTPTTKPPFDPTIELLP